MAELVASIIGIVSAGTKVAFVLSQLATDIGSAGHEARMIGGEIRSFCAVLKTLGETMEKIDASPYYAHCSDMVNDMTTASLEMFTEILNATESLKSLTTGRDGKDGNFGLVTRVQWAVFKKPKLLILRAAIEAYKSNLSLMLGTINTAEKVTRRISAKITPRTVAEDAQDRSLLESLELDREASLMDLAQAKHQYEETSLQLLSAPPDDKLAVNILEDQLVDLANSSDIEWKSDSLVRSVRKEIESIRSSLPGNTTFDDTAVQSQVTRHSQRVSKMLEHDQKRLSQRWSLSFSTSMTITSVQLPPATPQMSPTSNSGKSTDESVAEAPKSLSNEASMLMSTVQHSQSTNAPLSALDPRAIAHYAPFLSSLLQLDPDARQLVMRTLDRDALAESNINPKQHVPSQTKNHSALVLRNVSATSNEVPLASTEDHTGSEASANAQAYTSSQQLVDLVEEQILGWHGLELAKPSGSKSGTRPRGLTIDLRGQYMSSLPEELIDMMGHHVFRLVLRDNQLSNLPARLEICWHLRRLDLSNNKLETIPNVVVNLPYLEILNLRRNELRHLPYKIVKMSQLRSLSVEENYISAFPPMLGLMSNLVMLYAGDNPIVYPSRHQIDYSFPTSEDRDESVSSWTTHLKDFLKKQDILIWTERLRHLLRPFSINDSKDLGPIPTPPLPHIDSLPSLEDPEVPESQDVPRVNVIEVDDDAVAQPTLSPLEAVSPTAWLPSTKLEEDLPHQLDGVMAKLDSSRPSLISPLSAPSIGRLSLLPIPIVSDHRRSRSQNHFRSVDAEKAGPACDSRRRSHSVHDSSTDVKPFILLNAEASVNAEIPSNVPDASREAYNDNGLHLHPKFHQEVPPSPTQQNELPEGQLLEPLTTPDTYSSLDAAFDVSHTGDGNIQGSPSAKHTRSPSATPTRTPERSLSNGSSDHCLLLAPNGSSPTSPHLQTPTSPVSPGLRANSTNKRTSYAHHRNTRIFDDLVFHVPDVEGDHGV